MLRLNRGLEFKSNKFLGLNMVTNKRPHSKRGWGAGLNLGEPALELVP
jgi:hypothetical protein